MMTYRRTDRYQILRFLKDAALAVSLVTFAKQVSAEDLDITSRHTLGYSRQSQLISTSESQNAALTFTPYVESQWQIVQQPSKETKLTYDFGIEVTGLDEIETDLYAAATYQRNFGEKNAWQWRLIGTTTRVYADDTWSFQRERFAFRLQKRHSPEHTTSGRIRLGYRNQNENTFNGFDQTEFLADVTHFWRPNRDRLALSGTVYAEARRAEFDQFSYDEAGLRVLFRVPVSNDTEITARAAYYERDYQDGFSASNPTIRNDERFRLSIEADHKFTQAVSGKIWLGTDDNTSNITERDFDGSTFGISVTYDFD